MLTETFDRSEEIIRPEMIYGKRKKLCDICIITFSQHVIEYALQKYDCKKVISLESTGGSIPIYIMTYQEKELALYQSMIGAPAAGACLAEARCLTGASHYIMFGSCGCLHEEITAGKLIVPTCVSLAAALAVNNAGIGVAAGVSGIAPGWAALANFLVTLAALPLGRALGDKLAGRLLGKYALPLSGALLVLLGIWEAVG